MHSSPNFGVMTESYNRDNGTNESLPVPLPHVVRFVRQLSHDLRNHLNAIELQAAYMKEVAASPEVKGELQRLREMFSSMGGSLQRLGAALADVKLNPMPYGAAAFLEDLRAKVQSQFSEEASALQWQIDVGDAQLEIDPQLMEQALVELFANSFQHDRGKGAIEVTANCSAADFAFTLREPKTQFDASTENWGREPFGKVSHGHYGLGLHRARSIIEGHHGSYAAHFDPASSSLVTKVALPILVA